MAKKRRSLALAFILTLIMVTVGLGYGLTLFGAARPTGDKVSFAVTRGEATQVIAKNLKAQGLIRSEWAFRLTVMRLGLSGKLQAGTYQLSPADPVATIARSLTRGIADLKVTIPEGYRLEQIAEVMAGNLGFTTADFIKAGKPYEGELFPDTYHLAPGTTAPAVVATMRALYAQKTANLKLTRETLIIASLVERETKSAAEKPLVAGILQKRLAAGWPLELDATMQYIRGKSGDWWPNTTLADRKAASPYNTYLNQGLPPTPICNPGLASLQAAQSPVASDYWFYLHDPQGVIHYAATNAEHEANIRTYLY